MEHGGKVLQRVLMTRDQPTKILEPCKRPLDLPSVTIEPVERLIGDNAYDSDQLDRELAETGVEMIAPHRCDRANPTPDAAPYVATEPR